MWRVMRFLQQLLLLLIVCSGRISKISWCYDLYPAELTQRWIQSSPNSSWLLKNVAMKPVISSGDVVTHVAEYYSNTYITSVLTGGMATFDVYDFPNTHGTDQVILSRISVVNVRPEFNSILAGWMVAPSIYGDSKTHFFTAWTADVNGSVGCYNLACDGFVPVNNAPITPGDSLEPNNGNLKITVKIFKKKDDDDWWLHFGYDINNLTPVGYWPKSMFSSLADHANGIFWGGYTESYTGNASPPMGNGQWPGKNSASVQDIKYVDPNGDGYKPAPWPAGLTSHVSHKHCYQVSPYLDDMFYYGGPGGCTM